MIANIHDDFQRPLGRRRVAFPARLSQDPDDPVFPAGELDATFARLGKSLVPARIWVRSGEGFYSRDDMPSLLIDAGTLCQIGGHLVPGEGIGSGLFCQIVSGPHRAVRFEYHAADFRIGRRLPGDPRNSFLTSNQLPSRS